MFTLLLKWLTAFHLLEAAIEDIQKRDTNIILLISYFLLTLTIRIVGSMYNGLNFILMPGLFAFSSLLIGCILFIKRIWYEGDLLLFALIVFALGNSFEYFYLYAFVLIVTAEYLLGFWALSVYWKAKRRIRNKDILIITLSAIIIMGIVIEFNLPLKISIPLLGLPLGFFLQFHMKEINELRIKKIHTKNLKPGMIIVEKVVYNGKIIYDTTEKLNSKLSEEDVEKLKKYNIHVAVLNERIGFPFNVAFLVAFIIFELLLSFP